MTKPHEPVPFHRVLAVILGGGAGTRLFPLTQDRAKPAVPLGGKYRIVDIPISNCINSGLKRIYVLTQFNSASLHRHISQSYKFDHFSSGFVEILAAEQTEAHLNHSVALYNAGLNGQDLQQAFPGVDLRGDVMEFLEVAYGKGWIRIK